MQWWADDLKAIKTAREATTDPSSLDPWKSSVDLPHLDTYEQRFRFRTMAVERSYWLDHLHEVECSTERIERFEQCGRQSYLYKNLADDSYVLRSDTCKLRICPACRRRYRYAAIARVRALLDDIKPHTWQFMTFTVRHTRAPLRQQMDFLKACFRKLRQRSLWRKSCTHGYVVIENKYNPEKDEWHPHLHMIVKCRYIDWSALHRVWFQITNGSHVVDCGYISSVGKACDYVAKYIAKPPFLTDITSVERLQDYYDAIQNVRLLMPFGKPPRIKQPPTLDTPRKLEPIGNLGDLHHRASRGDTFALTVLRALARQIDATDRRTDPDLRKSIDPSIAYDPNDLLLPEPPP